MRRLFAFLSVCLCLLVSSFLVGAGGLQAGRLSAPGPNPSWTEMQKFEWYLGYLSRAANICGTYEESAVLRNLARMSPYGKIGLGAVSGDGFAGPVCGRLNNKARELSGDADQIREYIEATYDCKGEGCYGQSLDSWAFHACGDSLKTHFAILGLDDGDIRATTMINPRKMDSDAAHQARVRFHSCQGSLYIELTEQCIMDASYTRGDCRFDGVDVF